MNLYELDRSVFSLLNHSLSSPVLDVIMPWLTSRGYLLLIPLMLVMLWKGFRSREAQGTFTIHTALWAFAGAFLAFLVADWLGNEIKHLVARVRPCRVLEDVRLLVGCTQSGSMPSNHAGNYFAYAVALFWFLRKDFGLGWKLYPFALATLVCISRIYLGVHYPSDVLTGALLGTVVALGLIALYKYTHNAFREKSYGKLLVVGLVVISIFRIYYILHGPLDLSPDEAHYWEWARRLDLSYYSKGPMIAYLIHFGTLLFGDTVFGIRSMALIFSALSSVLLYTLVSRMYSAHSAEMSSDAGKLWGFSAALLLQVVPLFAPFGVLFTIDSPFIFFWILSLLLFWNAVKSEQTAARTMPWLVLGISVGLGLLTKYTMAFFMVSALLFLLASDKRYLLKTGEPYLAALVSLLVFSPVLIWNIQNDFVTFRHTAGQAHLAEGFALSLKTFGEFLGSQVGVITPLLFGMSFYALFKLRRGEGKLHREKLQSQFLFWFALPIIIFFLLKSVQGKVQTNWAMTGYITGLIALVRWYIRPRTSYGHQRPRKILLTAGIALALLVTSVAFYPSLINLPPKQDPSSRLRGWEALGKEISPLYKELSKESDVFIFSDRYQVSSELAFYVQGHPTTYSINLGRRMNQYDLWPDLNSAVARASSDGIDRPIHGIFVTIDDREVPGELQNSCGQIERRVLTLHDKKHVLRHYSIFICYNLRGLRTDSPKAY